MSKVRINDLARELEVKSRSILDALTAVGVTETKTHSSSIEADEAEKVRNYFKNRRTGGGTTKAAAEIKPTFDLSHISKPGDALKAILARKQAEADARSAPSRPAVVVTPPATSTAAPAARPIAPVTARPVAPAAQASAPVATPPAATAPAPRRIVPLPRQGAQIVNPAPTPPAIASRPPAGAVIARPPVVVAPHGATPTTHAQPAGTQPHGVQAHAAAPVVVAPAVAVAPPAAKQAAPAAAPVVATPAAAVVAAPVAPAAPETVPAI
jgi:translation initiation factor IF-2